MLGEGQTETYMRGYNVHSHCFCHNHRFGDIGRQHAATSNCTIEAIALGEKVSCPPTVHVLNNIFIAHQASNRVQNHLVILALVAH